MSHGSGGAVTHVNVTIAGRPYRMACDAGDEARIVALAARVDARIGELASAFGTIDDLRLTVMAAFSIADDLASADRRLAEREAEIAQLQEQLATEKERAGAQEAQIAAAVNAVAERVENITADLTPTVQA
ncbi:cell division protein ZapA [Pseudochelatococcus lubricantis]|uniref:cell division protein ZapA n=1 Tax=Pseudochelatococcus lubricantis TaxID=1538102 RepID=UPI0035E9E7F7